MKLYIPFNSNDFNNVFATLSISPRSFYYERDFGFKRATPSKLNPFDDVLVAFRRPTIISQDTDFDNGYPINLVVEINGLSKKAKKADVLFVKNTVYLFDDFKILYRTDGEKKEVESKSLKSVETKFLALAKSRSRTPSKNEDVSWFDTELSKDMFEGYSENPVSRSILKPERQINKTFGALIGFAIGSQRNLPKEFRKIHQLSKELKNQVSLFINRIGQANQNQEKKDVYRILSLIQEEVEEIRSLENFFLENTEGNIDVKFLEHLKSLKLFEQNYFDLVKKGLLHSKMGNMPLPLKLEKAKQVLFFKINKKYPQSYVEKLNKHIKEILYDIDDLINEHVADTDFDVRNLEVKYDNKFLNFRASNSYDSQEAEYLDNILNFFINEDTFTSIDELHENRKGYLGDLGRYLKDHLKGFGDSTEAEYLRDLLSSFKSLTEPFDINSTSLDSLKSVALLFTKGRDFMQYREFVEGSSIINNEIGYAIWGAAFGYAGLPKTLTGSIFDKVEKCELVLDKLSDFTSKHVDPISNEITVGEISSEVISQVEEQSNSNTYEIKEVDNKETIEQKEKTNEGGVSSFLEEAKKIRGVEPNEILLNVIQDLFIQLENESTSTDLFDNGESKTQAFSNSLSKKQKGIKNFGPKTLKRIVDLYKSFHSGEH